MLACGERCKQAILFLPAGWLAGWLVVKHAGYKFITSRP